MTNRYRALKRAVKRGCPITEPRNCQGDLTSWYTRIGDVRCEFWKNGTLWISTPQETVQLRQFSPKLKRMLKRRGIQNPTELKPIEEYLQCP